MATTVVIQQPPAVLKLTKWDTGLLDCCDDMNTCVYQRLIFGLLMSIDSCYAFWCCPCFACSTTGKFGEYHCLPLLDIFSPAIFAACGIPLFVPPAVLSLRVAIRHKYGIKGSLCRDICTSCFCEWCAWCQMARELKKRKNAPVVFNVQSQAPAMVKTSQVNQSYVMPAGPANMGPQPGYGTPTPNVPGYGVPPPAGYVPQPQGPFVYNNY